MLNFIDFKKVVQKSSANDILELKLNIIKRIIKYKLDQAAIKTKASEVKAKKEMLLAIRAEKENESLKGLSIVDIDKMLRNL